MASLDTDVSVLIGVAVSSSLVAESVILLLLRVVRLNDADGTVHSFGLVFSFTCVY